MTIANPLQPPRAPVARALAPLHAAFFSHPARPYLYRSSSPVSHVTECRVFSPTIAVIYRDDTPFFFRSDARHGYPALRPVAVHKYPKAYPLEFASEDFPFPPSKERHRFAFIPPPLLSAAHGHPLVLFLRQFFTLCRLPFAVRGIAEPYQGAVCIVDSRPLIPGIPYIFASKHAGTGPIIFRKEDDDGHEDHDGCN